MAEEELFTSLLGCLGSRAGWELARCRVSAGLSNCGQGASTPSPAVGAWPPRAGEGERGVQLKEAEVVFRWTLKASAGFPFSLTVLFAFLPQKKRRGDAH